jgi:hypothetical protein
MDALPELELEKLILLGLCSRFSYLVDCRIKVSGVKKFVRKDWPALTIIFFSTFKYTRR